MSDSGRLDPALSQKNRAASDLVVLLSGLKTIWRDRGLLRGMQ